MAGEVFRLMTERGEFCVDDPKWNGPVRLEEEIGRFCKVLTGVKPKKSTLKNYIRAPLRQWRQGSET